MLGCQVIVLKFEIKVIDFLADGFIFFEMEIGHVRVFESLFDGNTLFGVEDKEFF